MQDYKRDCEIKKQPSYSGGSYSYLSDNCQRNVIDNSHHSRSS